MKKSKANSITICLIFLLFGTTLAQQKKLTVKATFSRQNIDQNIASSDLQKIKALLGEKNRIYSKNGLVSASLATTGYSESGESEIYQLTFFDAQDRIVNSIPSLGGIFIISNDGKHFITREYLGGALSFYSIKQIAPLQVHPIGRIQEVALSGDGTRVLAARQSKADVQLYSYDIQGNLLWHEKIPNSQVHTIAMSTTGKFSAMSATVLDPNRAELLTQRKKILQESRQKWFEENVRRMRQGLPKRKFASPSLPKIPKRKLLISLAIFFFDENGGLIDRTSHEGKVFKNLTFAHDAENYLTASSGIEMFVFNASSGQEAFKGEISFMGEIFSLDVNRQGEVVAAVIEHNTRNAAGYYFDRGLEDPRKLVLWNPNTSKQRLHEFESNLEIPREQFRVFFSHTSNTILTQAGEQVLLLTGN